MALVSFIAVRLDGKPPLEGNCIVFSSLEQIQEYFLEFWNFLSPNAIESKTLKNKLLGTVLYDLPPKLSSMIKAYPGIKGRNELQTDLQIVSDLILEDVLKYEDLEPLFLQECYCNAGALSNYASVSKEILRTRYENLFDHDNQAIITKPAFNKSGIDKDFTDITSQSMSRRPILLIGDVGVGKSTFINNLIKVEAKDVFDKALTFKIDLGTKIILTLDIRNAIIDEIIRQLDEIYNIDINELSNIKSTYFGEYEKFKKGPYQLLRESSDDRKKMEFDFFVEKQKDKSTHVQKSLKQIAKSQKKQIVIFLDNCDQRDYDTQQLAFLSAQEIAENWQPVTVFLSLRPETFHNSLKKGALSGYHPKAFTIAPPRVDMVIEKRLSFAKKIASGGIELKGNRGVGISSPKLISMLDILLYSFDVNYELYRFIDNVSCGNIRYAIDIVKNFIGSGHIDTKKILLQNDENLRDRNINYTIPIHEFVRAVIYGNNIHYNSDSSYIVNLFDIHFQHKEEHFLGLIVLSILDKSANSGKNNGFIEMQNLYFHLQGIGFIIDQIDTLINLFISKNLIEPSTRGVSYDKKLLPSSIRITTTGSYHNQYLHKSFTYIDAIIVDTPIFDNDTRGNILSVNSITDRLDRAEIFVNYLDKVWNNFDRSQTLFYDWENVSNSIKNEIEKIRQINNRQSYH